MPLLPSRPTLCLFDIDGTLLLAGGAGRRALSRAFDDHCSLPDAVAFPFSGMTDRFIVRQGLERCGIEPTATLIDALLERYLEYLQEEVALAPGFEVMPGVRELLTALQSIPGVALGLGTGNLERGARIKLGRARLLDFFTFGGYSCDHESRPALIRRAAERGARHLGLPLEACRGVVIGDTEMDVEAAQANGMQCLAVQTGGVSEERLRDAGATWIVETLRAPGVLERLIDPQG